MWKVTPDCLILNHQQSKPTTKYSIADHLRQRKPASSVLNLLNREAGTEDCLSHIGFRKIVPENILIANHFSSTFSGWSPCLFSLAAISQDTRFQDLNCHDCLAAQCVSVYRTRTGWHTEVWILLSFTVAGKQCKNMWGRRGGGVSEVGSTRR